ncbi:MAG TPA: ABC transporter ATP-binding protein [Candidatus Cryosericum sp.]|nr:ABC transporter ATP-binding protein [Candidatus Cryosericum sp.]HPS69182.1 ABC transporter ATP-binding protein [Candidatus Cryosericum sp.]
MKRLLRQSGSLVWLFIAAAIAGVTASVATVASAHLFGRAWSFITGKQPQDVTISVIRDWTIVVVAGMTATFLRKLLASQFSERLQARLRERVAARLAHASAGAMQAWHSGEISSRMSGDLFHVEQLVRNDVPQFIVQSLTAVLAATYMFMHNWLLTLASIAVTPLLLFVSSLLAKPLGPLAAAAQADLAQASVTVQEDLAGAEVARAAGMNGVLQHRYENSLDHWLNHSLEAARQVAKLYSAGTALSLVPFVVVFAAGGWMVLRGRLEFGMLIAFIQLVNYLSFPFQEMPRLIGQIHAGTAAAARVLELLDVPQERTGGITGNLDAKPLIKFRHVTFTYPGTPQPQLRDVSFQVVRGQKVALVGASGSGKSTVIRLLTGEYEPQAGELRVGGVTTSEWSLQALRTVMAVVDQDAFLFDDAIRTNVASGRLDASGEEISAALEAAQCAFVPGLPQGIETSVGEAGGSLSGGQRQRIALARALVRNTPILLLDEATSALDNQMEQDVYTAITHGTHDRTIIAVAHRLSTVKDFDCIVVFEDGQVVEQGTHENLLKAGGLYARLWSMQHMQEAPHA